jgi:hypothetical protein
MEEGGRTLKILTDKPTGRRALRRSRLRWKNDVRTNLKKIGLNVRNWVDLAQDRILGEPL